MTVSNITNGAQGAVSVSPVKRLAGSISVPGDKSISHRAAMIATLAEGRSTIRNFSTAADCQSTVECLRALGAAIHREGPTVTIDGTGQLRAPARVLDAGNSGTTMRLLAGVLAGQPFASTITGDESLRSRPMRRVAEPLCLMGAKVETEPNGCAPLRISGRRPLRPIHYALPVASAQIKSAVLLAGLAAEGPTSVEQPVPTRDHTERMLREFGAQVECEGATIRIAGGARLAARDFHVPGDFSSAAFFIAAAVVLPGSDLVIRDVGLNPTRTAFLSVLKEMGAQVSLEDERLECGEPVGTLRARGGQRGTLRPAIVSGSIIPNVIDELPLLGFIAGAAGSTLEVRDARELRVKESDRVMATVENLRRMGARAEERADGWLIEGAERLRGAELDSYGDHRIAMACAVAALAARYPSQIKGAESAVAVSLPEFWAILRAVTE
jgi:3-phosphoshikimate 1-carboxyvinyltransferase